jgi:PAS domain S-box-containing protein
MLRSQTVKSPIARRFILYIVLFSSLITLFITAIQLYRDYNSDIELIHAELEQIENIHLNSLSSALWTSNRKLLQISIEGILKTRDVQYVEIRDEQQLWAKAGKVIGDNNIQRYYAVEYRHRNKDINIGKLNVNVSLAGVYQRLLDKVWVILISNGVKTSLVAMFIYFLFYRLVARHLSTISEFSERHDPLVNNKLLLLERTGKKQDEFDAVVKSINDMQARLHAQISEIDQQKQYLSQTLNSIGDAVITTDAEGRVTRLNPVAEELTGWTNDEALQQPLKNIFTIIHTSTREAITDSVEKVLAKGSILYLSNHTTLVAKHGEEYQIADSAAPIRNENEVLGMVLVFNDVTEQYKMRQALIESEEKLRFIYSQVPGIVYQFKVDINGKKFLPYVSPAVEKYIGLTAEEVMEDAELWFGLTHPDDYPELEKSILESLTNLGMWTWEGRFIRKDGDTVWLRGTSTPERMADGGTLWNGLFVDVTERVHADEVVRRAQKIDALGKLTGGIAHDYNNMLGVVLGYAELLKAMLSEQPRLQGYIEEITRAAERGAKLTKKLLAFSRSKSSDARKLNISTLLEEERLMLEKTLTARIKLELKLEPDLWPVYLDEGELEDAILNMSINAMHAIEGSGQLSIATSNEKINSAEGKKLKLEEGDYIRLTISDTGCGMDKETQDRIFDPFYSTKGEKGTGLGLSQVYGFINRCGGSIHVDSTPRQGSQFSLYFARYRGDNVSEYENKVNNKADLKGEESILVVDDEMALLNLACEILTKHGYNVFRAEDAKQALQILDTERIDLLVSDIIMPEMDGYAFASIVQEKYPDIKIQLISGFSGGENTLQIDDILQQNIIYKPYKAQSLLLRIRALLE